MDLEAQIKSLDHELREVVAQVITEKSFIQGTHVADFTRAFLKTHGGTYGVGCANGTSAITVALRALGVGPGDEVLVPNHTFFGTVEPIVEVGATPVLVDVDEEHHQFDLVAAARAVTKKTRAIIPVHLYGLPEPMDQVMDFARAHELVVIEDCAQAHLAKWRGRAVGTFGDLATFSFFPGKNLGAFGDAGFILTENQNHYDFARKYVDHGRTEKYLHESFGGNVRMDGLQGAVLSVKLGRLAEWTARRRDVALRYDERLRARDFRVLKPRDGAEPAYHLYVVEVANRDQVTAAFTSAGVGFGVHYPVTMNLQPAFAKLGYKPGQFPVSERRAGRILSLPFFPELTDAQMDKTLEVFFKMAKP